MKQKIEAYTPLDFRLINKIAQAFANHIELHRQELEDVLLEYESYEVVQDETARTLDLLRNLKENKKYFWLRVGPVTSFLPRNQPLYALACFVVVPSLMAKEVHFRIPQSMKHFFSRMLYILQLSEFFPNVFVSNKQRLEFLKERTAFRVNPKTGESIPQTDAVIFTGLPYHAEQLRLVFEKKTLFILNGAGHNPIVVAKDADSARAAEAIISLQLYNQGQDCAAPNAVLVNQRIFPVILDRLRQELGNAKIGDYRDKSCRVGRISNTKDLSRIQEILVKNYQWLDPSTPGTIHTKDALVEPAIICKPLKEGGNFTELYAPIIFLQVYDEDRDLSLYFENSRYPRNAMYISLYGTSEYISKLVGKKFDGRVLHDSRSILRNAHLHMPGVERGTKPYGGNGYAASSLSINGKIVCKPTLPQRDIYEWIAKPLIDKSALKRKKKLVKDCLRIVTKDIHKIFSLRTNHSNESTNGSTQTPSTYYFDSKGLAENNHRYLRILPNHAYHVLDHPNLEHISSMIPEDFKQINTLVSFIRQNPQIDRDSLKHQLYTIPKNPNITQEENHNRQLNFFRHLYQLLLGKNSGPRLENFLPDLDRDKVYELMGI